MKSVIIGTLGFVVALLIGLGLGLIFKYNKLRDASREAQPNENKIQNPGVDLPYTDERLSYLSGRSEENLKTLRQVNIILRHGARNQLSSFRNDPPYYRIPPIGVGQLTSLGKRQAYSFGRVLRHRYSGFQSEGYTNSEVHATSSDADRTITTIQTFLAAYFPPLPANDSENHWEGNLRWNPIPVHGVSREMDNFISTDNYVCPRYAKLMHEVHGSQRIQTILDENEELLGYISQWSGRPIRSLREIYLMQDVFKVLTAHGVELPGWADQVFPNRTDPLTKLFFSTFVESRDMRVLRVGPLYTRLLGNMEYGRVGKGVGGNGTANRTYLLSGVDTTSAGIQAKTFLYSGHDTTIDGLMASLGLENEALQAYCAALILELHFDNSTGYFVKFFHFNGPASPPDELTSPDCGTPCSLPAFKEKFRWLFITDNQHKTKCKLSIS